VIDILLLLPTAMGDLGRIEMEEIGAVIHGEALLIKLHLQMEDKGSLRGGMVSTTVKHGRCHVAGVAVHEENIMAVNYVETSLLSTSIAPHSLVKSVAGVMESFERVLAEIRMKS